MVTVANMYIYTIIAGLMRSRFRKYCVNFASFSILYNFAPTNASALSHKLILYKHKPLFLFHFFLLTIWSKPI